MKIKKAKSAGLILACIAATGLTGCGKTDETSKKHEAITFMAPYLEVDSFIEEVHKTYPEINLEVITYSGSNTTTYLQNMLEADDLPDICTQTFYKPDVVDVSDKMIDLSGYDFTDNYVESRLKEVSDDGALYMLPSLYNCYGITYNKTLLEQHGWKLPTSFTELEELADKAKEAGVTLCMAQIQYPGSAFQYICNIADAGFLGTLSGKQWQKDYLSGKANVSDTEGMMDSMEYIQKWKDIGMLDSSNSDPTDDGKTKEAFIKGKSLFLLGPQNGIMDSEEVMKVLSTVEGTSALYPESTLKAGLLPFKDAKADDTYYADISDFINAGNTTPFIYSGWENTIVNTGTKMLEFMQDKASIKDVADQLDEDQDSVVNNQPEVFTTATEEISQESCAKLVGRCFAEATGSDIALISIGTWISGNGTNQNNGGVSGKLYAKNITDYDICTILPTGWSQTIQTVRLTGKQIQDLYKEGYDAVGTGNNYPYVLVSPMELEDEKTYQVAISGISEKLASEAEVTDSGIVGMDAAKEFFGQFETLSEADAEWK